MFISLISTIWGQTQMSFILLYGFLHNFFELQAHAYVYLQLNSSVSSPSAITCNTPGNVHASIMIRVEGAGVCCVPNCNELHSAGWLQGETSQTETSQNWYQNLNLTYIHRKTRTFLLRVTATLMTQMTLLTQTSNSRLTKQTVDLLYLKSTGLQGV